VEFEGELLTAREAARRSGFHLSTIRDWSAAGLLERGYVELRVWRRELRKQAKAAGISDGLLRARLWRGVEPLAPVRRAA
jgi:hypothetical protein